MKSAKRNMKSKKKSQCPPSFEYISYLCKQIEILYITFGLTRVIHLENIMPTFMGAYLSSQSITKRCFYDYLLLLKMLDLRTNRLSGRK